jgi:hypothetical protein
MSTLILWSQEEHEQASKTCEAVPAAQTRKAGQEARRTQTAEAAEETAATETYRSLLREERIRMTSAPLAIARRHTARTPLAERIRGFMYPVFLIERVVNYLGVIGILSIVAGCVLGVMGKPVPDMVIFGAGTAIGALAGIAQANHTGKEGQKEIAGVPVQEVPEGVVKLLEQQRQEIAELSKRVREMEAA